MSAGVRSEQLLYNNIKNSTPYFKMGYIDDVKSEVTT